MRYQSGKYQNFKTKFANEILTIGVNDTVAFNGEIPNNSYDSYVWDQLINRGMGFPLLIKIHSKGISQTPLKDDFQAFFKKEIDLTQLLGSMKWKMTHTENEY